MEALSKHIEVKNLTKIYKNKEREFKAVDDVTLSINKNDIFTIIQGYTSIKQYKRWILQCYSLNKTMICQ